MLKLFDSFFYQLKVVEENNVVKVSGIKHAQTMIGRLNRMMNTSRVGTYLLLASTSTSFSFYAFHATDMIYLLNQLQTKGKFGSGDVPIKTIRSIIRAIEENTWVKNTFKTYPTLLDRSRLNDFTVTPMGHQEEFFTHYDKTVPANRLTGMMTAASPGSGKTLMSLFLQRMLPVKRVIIVCPLPTLIDVWVNTLTTYFHSPPVFWHSRMTTAIPDNVEYIVVHYEYLSNLLSNHNLRPSMAYGVILDESHNFTGPSNRTSVFIDMCNSLKSSHTLWLSGTPIKATALEAMPLIRTIDPLFTPAVEARARKAFAGNNVEMNLMLGSRLNVYMRKVEKDVLDLPAPIEIALPIQLKNGDRFTTPVVVADIKAFILKQTKYYESRSKADKQVFLECLAIFEKGLKQQSAKQQYDKYRADLSIVISKKGFIMEIPDIVRSVNVYETKVIMPALSLDVRRKFKDVRALYKYPSLKVVGEALGQVLSARRIECFTALASAIDYAGIIEKTEHKTIVFTSNVESVVAAGAACVDQGLSPVMVYGSAGTPIPTAVKWMGTDPEKDPLISTYQSLGTGVPLVMCNAIIFINLPFRPHVLGQAIARAQRIGQTQQVYLYKVVLDTGTEGNLSTRTQDIMDEANKAVKEITGMDYIPTEVLPESNDFFDTSVEGINVSEYLTLFEPTSAI